MKGAPALGVQVIQTSVEEGMVAAGPAGGWVTVAGVQPEVGYFVEEANKAGVIHRRVQEMSPAWQMEQLIKKKIRQEKKSGQLVCQQAICEKENTIVGTSPQTSIGTRTIVWEISLHDCRDQ